MLISCDTSIIRLSTSCNISNGFLSDSSYSDALTSALTAIPSISLILSSPELSSISAPDNSFIIFCRLLSFLNWASSSSSSPFFNPAAVISLTSYSRNDISLCLSSLSLSILLSSFLHST